MTFWCVLCQEKYTIAGKVPAICPACKRETTWTTAMAEPRVAWETSLMDLRFLKQLHISRE